jgi:hypothetical protein
MTTKPRKIPAALAKNAAKSARLHKVRVTALARDDIALIRLKKMEIAEAFFEVGEALARLRKKGVADALGYGGFTELVKNELDFSVEFAEQLIDVATIVPRAHAVRWGQTKSIAVAEIAKAAGSAAPIQVGPKMLLPSGKVFDAASATPAEARMEAKALRQARRGPSQRGRGRTTTRDERTLAATIQAKLHKHGLREARATAVAGKPGGVSHLRIERIPMDRLAALATALRDAIRD